MINWKLLPNCCCIYYLYEKDKLQYIGETKNLRTRIYQHLCLNKSFLKHRQVPIEIDTILHRITDIIYFKCDITKLLSNQHNQIKQFRPSYNHSSFHIFNHLNTQ